MLRRTELNEALEALAAQLETKGKRRELVVIGGSGLIALGLIERPTRDVDVGLSRASRVWSRPTRCRQT